MNTQSRKFPFFFILMSLVVLAFATSACSFRLPHLGGFSQVVEISLDEELFSQGQPTFKVQGHDFWEDLDVDIDRLELHEGYLRFIGSRQMPDGTRLPCSIDLSLGTADGMLTAAIIAVDIPGIALTDPRVIVINQELETHLSLAGYDSHAEILFTDVDVTEGELRIKVQVNVDL